MFFTSLQQSDKVCLFLGQLTHLLEESFPVGSLQFLPGHLRSDGKGLFQKMGQLSKEETDFVRLLKRCEEHAADSHGLLWSDPTRFSKYLYTLDERLCKMEQRGKKSIAEGFSVLFEIPLVRLKDYRSRLVFLQKVNSKIDHDTANQLLKGTRPAPVLEDAEPPHFTPTQRPSEVVESSPTNTTESSIENIDEAVRYFRDSSEQQSVMRKRNQIIHQVATSTTVSQRAALFENQSEIGSSNAHQRKSLNFRESMKSFEDEREMRLKMLEESASQLRQQSQVMSDVIKKDLKTIHATEDVVTKSLETLQETNKGLKVSRISSHF
eukprot:TRINITY_DN2216_c0_g2_i3.p1 TRINITY_DN2216_c0_g2~~TRINITY_DN2216_c0_g2_i3.p1  ORF type:complete len:323 (+),score=72.25 TRINITY_DN2216_c0_g2_i3:1232-2200(+)